MLRKDGVIALTTTPRYNLATLNPDEHSATTLPQHSKALLWTFVAAIIAIHVFFLWSVRSGIKRGDPDFTVFYTAASMLRHGLGHQLYDPRAQQLAQAEFTQNLDIRRGALPYIHPPFEALMFLPLTYFPYAQAFLLWNVLNLGMLFGMGDLLTRWLPSLQRFSVVEFVLLSLAFFPVFANFHQGQDAILLLLVVSLSFRALGRDADSLAGCWLAFGLFKYHLILPLALILVVWRGRKFFSGFAAISLAELAISCALVGWRGVVQYPSYAWRVVSQPAFGGIPPRQMPNLLGLLGGWFSVGASGWLLPGVVGGCSLALMIAVAGLRNLVFDKERLRLGLACAVITALLVGYSTNSYDLSLLIVPLAIIFKYSFRADSRQLFEKMALLLPVTPLLISPLWFFLWMGFQRINVMGFFLVWWVYAIRSELLRLKKSESKLHSGVRLEAHA